MHDHYTDAGFFADSDVKAPPFSPFSVVDIEEANDIDEESDVESIEAPPFSPLSVEEAEMNTVDEERLSDNEAESKYESSANVTGIYNFLVS